MKLVTDRDTYCDECQTLDGPFVTFDAVGDVEERFVDICLPCIEKARKLLDTEPPPADTGGVNER